NGLQLWRSQSSGLFPAAGEKFFAGRPQIPCRRSALRAKFIENLRKQAQCAYLLPSGGMEVRSNKNAANARWGWQVRDPDDAGAETGRENTPEREVSDLLGAIVHLSAHDFAWVAQFFSLLILPFAHEDLAIVAGTYLVVNDIMAVGLVA